MRSCPLNCLSARAPTCTTPLLQHRHRSRRFGVLHIQPGCRRLQCRTDQASAGTGTRQADKQLPMLNPRQYQRELIELLKDTNAIVTLPTGSGKTLIATEIIRNKLGVLKQAGQVAVFLAPTNPLADQIQQVLQGHCTSDSHGAEQPPLKCQAFHGDTGRVSIGTWDAEKWKEKLTDLDVIVMTPELLLHCLAHASLKMSQIGIIAFDEAHHCASDHPYAQIMEDFYHTSPANSRPQIVGLTASPIGVEGLIPTGKKKKKSKGKGDATGPEYGLQGRMNARLITLDEQHRPELQHTTPVPLDEFVDYNDQDPAWVINAQLQGAAADLEAANKDCLVHAKKCATMLTQLQRQAAVAEAGTLEGGGHPDLKCFAERNGPSFGSMTALAKQVNGVKYCLTALGPWGAAAAAHLDLLSAVPDSAAGDGLGGDWAELAEEGEGDEEQEEDADKDSGDVAAGVGGMSDMELAKMMQDDDLGADADTLIEALRGCLGSIHTYLQELSARRPAVLTHSDLAAALQPADSAGNFYAMSAGELSAVAPLLLGLVGKSSVLLVITLLTELLVTDARVRQVILNGPELHAAAAKPALRAEGVLQRISGQLLQQVPFTVLQAQMWPEFPAPSLWPSSMPPLLSPKLKRVAQHLSDRQREAGQGQDWAAIVFVETKLTALVLYKLLCSCPDMRKELRAGFLVGNTEGAGGTAELGMSHSRQKDMIRRFRESELNVLVCTNIGSEGMDFRQCQMVVAYDPPPNVTLYIQSRGRARAQGSRYAWLRPSGFKERAQVETKKQSLLDESAKLEAHAAHVSEQRRQELQLHKGQPPLLRTDREPHNLAHLVTPKGGVATMRLAQVLLAGFCARLPGTDSLYIPQAWYKTVGGQGAFRTTIYLPPGASQTPMVQGDYHQNQKSAKNAAALAAIKQLHQEGKMNNCLFPSWVSAHHAQQLAAEAIPSFLHTRCLQDPLKPRPLHLQPQQTVTLHMHSFEYTVSAHQQGSESSEGAASLLHLAVGDPMRCKAVPGSSSSCGDSSSGAKRISFGVLSWEQLPGAVGGPSAGGSTVQLDFPAWVSSGQQEPSNVRVVYQGAVTLTVPDLLTLMKYQQCLNNTINWSNKNLLGLKRADREESQSEMQRQFGGAFKPLNPAAFDDKIGFAALADAVAAQSAEDMQAAVAALQGADLCYLFAPLQQQSAAINWQAIASMGQGLRPAVSLLGQAASAVPSSQTEATAAAMAAVPAGISARHVTQAHLQDAVLLAGHSSQLYRCKGVASDVTPTTPCGFAWSSSADSNSSLRKRTKHTADNHAQYYSERYGVQGLRGDLPMLQVTQSGRQKAMQLMQYPLKPPTLQRGVKRAGAAHRPTDLTTAEAAAAACDFSFLQRAHQAGTQQEDEQAYKLYLPLELCWVLPLPAHQWQELQLLPAFMYRIDSLLRLQQAQQQLFPVDATDGGSGSLPPQLLMAAVTAPGAGEVFDMEGLEYLGDVVLKMLTTNYLLHPEVNDVNKNEGELSVKKATIIRNVQLARKAQNPHLSLQQHLHLHRYQPDLYTPTGHLPAGQQAGTAASAAAAGPVGLYALSQQQPISVRGKRLADCVEALIGAVYLSATAAAAGRSAAAALGCGSGSGGLPVSEAGLKAAAEFCEAAHILPKGSAALACRPCFGAFATTPNNGGQQQQTSGLQLLQQQVLGHTFSNPGLLQQALTHVSRAGGSSYQRLEFLGDAVLDLYVSSWLMMQLGQALQQQAGSVGSIPSVYAPAELTWRRAALVNNINLARAAADAQLQQHLRAHSGPLMRVIKRFAAKQQQQQGPQQTDTTHSSGPGARVFAVLAAAATAVGHSAGLRSVAKASSWGDEDEDIWREVWASSSSSGLDEDQDDNQAAAEGVAGSAVGAVDDSHSGVAGATVGTHPSAAAAAVKQRAPKALADIVESLVGAVLVDSSSGSHGAGGSSSRVGGGSYNWAAAWQAVRQLLPGMSGS